MRISCTNEMFLFSVSSQSVPKQVYTFYEDKITWVEAQDACTTRDAYLPIISDKSVLRELLYGRTDFRYATIVTIVTQIAVVLL